MEKNCLDYFERECFANRLLMRASSVLYLLIFDSLVSFI